MRSYSLAKKCTKASASGIIPIELLRAVSKAVVDRVLVAYAVNIRLAGRLIKCLLLMQCKKSIVFQETRSNNSTYQPFRR